MQTTCSTFFEFKNSIFLLSHAKLQDHSTFYNCTWKRKNVPWFPVTICELEGQVNTCAILVELSTGSQSFMHHFTLVLQQHSLSCGLFTEVTSSLFSQSHKTRVSTQFSLLHSWYSILIDSGKKYRVSILDSKETVNIHLPVTVLTLLSFCQCFLL